MLAKPSIIKALRRLLCVKLNSEIRHRFSFLHACSEVACLMPLLFFLPFRFRAAGNSASSRHPQSSAGRLSLSLFYAYPSFPFAVAP